MKHIREADIEGVRAPKPHARTLKHLLSPWRDGSMRVWVGLSNIDPRSSSNRHRHDDKEEVFYVVSGSGEMVVGYEREAIQVGSLILVPPGSEHQLVNDNDEALTVLSVVSPPFNPSEFDLQHSISGT